MGVLSRDCARENGGDSCACERQRGYVLGCAPGPSGKQRFCSAPPNKFLSRGPRAEPPFPELRADSLYWRRFFGELSLNGLCLSKISSRSRALCEQRLTAYINELRARRKPEPVAHSQ